MEVVELLLRGMVRIFDLEEDPEPVEDFAGTVERTPEGRFLLVYPEDPQAFAAAKRLIDDLYYEDPFKAGRFLYAVRWELQTELEETALRWRSARLEDLGFPTQEEAASLYARVDLGAELPPPPGVPDEPPGFFLAERGVSRLFDLSLAFVDGERRETLELELVTVMNAALVADRIPVREVDAVREAAEAVRDTLSLGLDHLAKGSPEAGAEILERSALKHIFQVGFTRTLELRWRADELRAKLPVELDKGSFLPDGEDGERFAALFLKRPRTYAPGRDERPGKVRAFASLDELEEASRSLDAIEAVGAAFLSAGLSPEEAKEEVVSSWGEAGLARVKWSDLLLTAAARKFVGLSPTFVALPEAKISEAARATFNQDGSLRAEARDVVASLLGVGEALAGFASSALARLEEELGPQIAASGFDGLQPHLSAPWIVR